MTNKEIIQQCYADFGSGRIPDLLEKLSDRIVWVDPGQIGTLYKGTRNGKKEVQEFFNQLQQELTITAFDVLALNECGNKVYAEGTIGGTGNNTKKNFSLEWVMIWQLENGLVVRHQLFIDTLTVAGVLNALPVPEALHM